MIKALTFFLFLMLPALAPALEYGTCGLKPTEYYFYEGYDDPYVIIETFYGFENGLELYDVEIGQDYLGSYFVVGRYRVVMDPEDCSYVKTESVFP